ncbi:hypothetical protein MTR67_053665 [Solanum verrucosum]|uniref:RING-type domain-containing protein n=1 Tax=Solanum verrucosum TaxID=315347 RepID=A0AAF0V802_SOLVR|nr:hypothetical protein MTR67_053665 [Solanum verrucosum]
MSNIVRPCVIFAIVLAIILVVLFLFIKFICARFQERAVTPPGTNSECCICLGEFEKQDNGDADDDTITLPTCYHRFHATCIMSWLLLAKKNTCPFCRTCISTTFIICIYWYFRHLIKPSSQLTVT